MCFNRHVSSEEYVSSLKHLQKVYQTDNEHFHRLMTDVMTSIRVQVLKDHKPTEMEQSHPDIHAVAHDAELSGPGRGKVRYVAGYVVAKLKYRNSK